MSQLLSTISVLSITAQATASVIAKTFVGFDGAPAGAGAASLGIAQTSAATGEDFGVDVLGIVDMPAGAAIAVGAAVEVDAAGKPITKNAGAAVGTALTAAAAPGDIVKILLK